MNQNLKEFNELTFTEAAERIEHIALNIQETLREHDGKLGTDELFVALSTHQQFTVQETRAGLSFAYATHLVNIDDRNKIVTLATQL